MKKGNIIIPKKAWESPSLVLIGTNDINAKNHYTNKEANYHNIGGTKYANSKSTLFVSKHYVDSFHS